MPAPPKALGTVPTFSIERARRRYPQAQKLAKMVRDALQLGDHPGRSLLWVLEEVCGVKVFHLDFEPTGTAASAVSERFKYAVLLNKGNVSWRRTFDLAHELFHLLTWNLFHAHDADEAVASDREEKLATCFAANLLMPTDAIQPALNDCMANGRIKIDRLFDVARQFDVSVEALLWRMHFLYNRDERYTKDDIDRAKALAPIYEERDPPSVREYPARYRALAIKALYHGEISIGRFAEYLNISRQEAMQIAERETVNGDEVQVTAT